MSDKIEAAKRRVEATRGAYVAAVNELDALLKATCPFQPGDLIRSTSGTVAKVTEIRIRYDRIETVAVRQKKDGSFGVREVPMWRGEWKNAVLHEKSQL